MLGKFVRVKVTAPINSVNRRFGYKYELNYGVIEQKNKFRRPSQKAYIMGVSEPVKRFYGRVIAVIQRFNNRGTVYVVAPAQDRYINNQIVEALSFSENDKYYDITCFYEISCGTIIYHDNSEGRKILLIKNKRSYSWGFPKGHIEKDETNRQTALREAKEETGLDVELVGEFSSVSEYTLKNKVEKRVIIFLGRSDTDSVVKQESEIEAFMWVDFNTAFKMLNFENDKRILRECVSYMESNGI